MSNEASVYQEPLTGVRFAGLLNRGPIGRLSWDYGEFKFQNLLLSIGENREALSFFRSHTLFPARRPRSDSESDDDHQLEW